MHSHCFQNYVTREKWYGLQVQCRCWSKAFGPWVLRTLSWNKNPFHKVTKMSVRAMCYGLFGVWDEGLKREEERSPFLDSAVSIWKTKVKVRLPPPRLFLDWNKSAATGTIEACLLLRSSTRVLAVPWTHPHLPRSLFWFPPNSAEEVWTSSDACFPGLACG